MLGLLEKAAKEDAAFWPSGGWLQHALQATYYWLLHAKDFRSALLAVVNQLGDPDTNGAIVGAMLGAVYGRSGIPAEWVETVLDFGAGPPGLRVRCGGAARNWLLAGAGSPISRGTPIT